MHGELLHFVTTLSNVGTVVNYTVSFYVYSFICKQTHVTRRISKLLKNKHVSRSSAVTNNNLLAQLEYKFIIWNKSATILSVLANKHVKIKTHKINQKLTRSCSRRSLRSRLHCRLSRLAFVVRIVRSTSAHVAPFYEIVCKLTSSSTEISAFCEIIWVSFVIFDLLEEVMRPPTKWHKRPMHSLWLL